MRLVWLEPEGSRFILLNRLEFEIPVDRDNGAIATIVSALERPLILLRELHCNIMLVALKARRSRVSQVQSGA